MGDWGNERSVCHCRDGTPSSVKWVIEAMKDLCAIKHAKTFVVTSSLAFNM
jgi:hypothetical protein